MGIMEERLERIAEARNLAHIARMNTHIAVLECGKTEDSFHVDIVAVTDFEYREIGGIKLGGITCLNFRTQKTDWYTKDEIMGFKLDGRVTLLGLELYLSDETRCPLVSPEKRAKLYEYVLTQLTKIPQ